jgi:hypothetical protein
MEYKHTHTKIVGVDKLGEPSLHTHNKRRPFPPTLAESHTHTPHRESP